MVTAYKITPRTYGVMCRSYASAAGLYLAKIARSRTSVAGVKAVRMDNDGLYHTTLRKTLDGDMVFRFWRADIATYKPDGTLIISTGGYSTVTTFIRIAQACGVVIQTLAESQHAIQYENRLRVFTDSSRLGIPFTDGMRINLNTKEIHADDVAKLPSDRRRPYDVPSKQATQEFKKLWAGLHQRMMFGINLGVWTQIAIEKHVTATGKPLSQMRPWDRYVNVASRYGRQDVSGLMLSFFAGEELDDDESYILFTNLIQYGARVSADDPEGITELLKGLVPKVRKHLLKEYARVNNMHETKGGNLKGGMYFTADVDRGTMK